MLVFGIRVFLCSLTTSHKAMAAALASKHRTDKLISKLNVSSTQASGNVRLPLG